MSAVPDELPTCTNPARACVQVPNELMLQLKQGPAKHIKNNAYAYRGKIDSELTRIGRIRDLQQRLVALTGTGIIAALVGTSNVLGKLL